MDKTSISDHFDNKKVLRLYHRKPRIVLIYDWLVVLSPQCLPLGVIHTYNINSGHWRRHTIENDKSYMKPTHEEFAGACVVAIDETICIYSSASRTRWMLWKLTKTGASFTWSVVETRGKIPWRRVRSASWEHGGRMWLFGGQITSYPNQLIRQHGLPLNREALMDHGDFDERVTNQLLYFEPTEKKWYNPAYSGVTPVPGVYEAAVWRDKVWMAGGRTGYLEHIYELDLNTLQFVAIQPRSDPAPSPIQWFSFTAVANNQLVLHGGTSGTDIRDEVSKDTWILSLDSKSWMKYPGETDIGRYGHTSHLGPNRSVLVFGGRSDKSEFLPNKNPFTVNLQAKDLEITAMHTIRKNRDILKPENSLPKILLNKIFGIW